MERQLMLPGLEDKRKQDFAETLVAIDGDGCFYEGDKASHYRERIDHVMSNHKEAIPRPVTRQTIENIIKSLEPDRASGLLLNIVHGFQILRLPKSVEDEMIPEERLAFYAGTGEICNNYNHYHPRSGRHKGFTVYGKEYEPKDVIGLEPEEQISTVVSYANQMYPESFPRTSPEKRVRYANDINRVGNNIHKLFAGPWTLYDPNLGKRKVTKSSIDNYIDYIVRQG